MLPLEFFPLALPLDTLQLVIDGLGVSVEVNKAKQFLQFVQTVTLAFMDVLMASVRSLWAAIWVSKSSSVAMPSRSEN